VRQPVRQPMRELVRELLRELPDLATTPRNHCYSTCCDATL
jgi:hypothetical protein